MPNKIEIFDFDGTLFRNPLDTPENRKLYEKKTGLPWIIDKEESRKLSKKHGKFIGMRRGWYGRRETLEPPLVPDPAPASMFIQPICERFRQSKADENTITIIMTGRHRGIANQVLRICGDGALIPVKRNGIKDGKLYVDSLAKDVQFFFMGDDGPAKMNSTKPSSTLPWKVWIMESLLEYYPEVDTIELWEDREEHVEEFQALNTAWPHHVIVNFVTD